jgi:carboxymethylenebutenolidase
MSAEETSCCPETAVGAGTPGTHEAGKVINLTFDLQACVLALLHAVICVSLAAAPEFPCAPAVPAGGSTAAAPPYFRSLLTRSLVRPPTCTHLTSFRYVSGNPDSSAALLVAYDIFGFQGQSRIRQVCDKLAAAGFYVVMPDFYRGEQITWEQFLAKVDIFAFIKRWKWEEHCKKDCFNALDHIAGLPNIKKVGAVGFCWGGWIAAKVAHAGQISAGYIPHPSVHVERAFGGDDTALVSESKCPLMFDTAGDDQPNLKAGGAAFEALKATAAGAGSVTRDFPDMQHGWTTRGDITNPAVAAGVEKALSGGIEFLQKHLLGAGGAAAAAPAAPAAHPVVVLGSCVRASCSSTPRCTCVIVASQVPKQMTNT